MGQDLKENPWVAARTAILSLLVGVFSYYMTTGVTGITTTLTEVQKAQASIKRDVEWLREGKEQAYGVKEAQLVFERLDAMDTRLLGRVESLNARISRLENERK